MNGYRLFAVGFSIVCIAGLVGLAISTTAITFTTGTAGYVVGPIFGVMFLGVGIIIVAVLQELWGGS